MATLPPSGAEICPQGASLECRRCFFSAVCGPIWLILSWMVRVGHGYLATRWHPHQPPVDTPEVYQRIRGLGNQGVHKKAQGVYQTFFLRQGHPYEQQNSSVEMHRTLQNPRVAKGFCPYLLRKYSALIKPFLASQECIICCAPSMCGVGVPNVEWLARVAWHERQNILLHYVY